MKNNRLILLISLFTFIQLSAFASTSVKGAHHVTNAYDYCPPPSAISMSSQGLVATTTAHDGTIIHWIDPGTAAYPPRNLQDAVIDVGTMNINCMYDEGVLMMPVSGRGASAPGPGIGNWDQNGAFCQSNNIMDCPFYFS